MISTPVTDERFVKVREASVACVGTRGPDPDYLRLVAIFRETLHH